MTDLRPILIAGPTASGKSSLALALAERVGGTIINADSMQVYSELRVLTARPSDADLARAPHRLYGHVPGNEAYSAGRYATEAKVAIDEALAANSRPIIVGGTGLYFRSLLSGLSPIPATPDAIRQHWRTQAERQGAKALHGILATRDPVMAARLEFADAQRIVRALEVLDATGRSLADWQSEPGKPILNEAETVRLVVCPERSELHQRADARFEAMIKAGALDEVRHLKTLNLNPALPVMRALGVRPLLQLIDDLMAQEKAIAQAKAETRQYIKRQTTWLRSNMITWTLLSLEQMKTQTATNFAFIDP